MTRFRLDVKNKLLRNPLQIMSWIQDRPKSEIVSEALVCYLELFFDQLKPSNPVNWLSEEEIQEWRDKLKDMLPVFEVKR